MFTGSFNLTFINCVKNRNFVQRSRYKTYHLLQGHREKPHLGKSRNLPNFFDFEKVIDKVDSVSAYSMIYHEHQKALNKVPHDSHPLKALAKEIQGRAWA